MRAVMSALAALACVWMAACTAAGAAAVPVPDGSMADAVLPPRAAPSAEPSTHLTALLVHGGLSREAAVACPSWDAGSASWEVPPDAPKHSATGGPLPRQGMIDGVTYAICYDATGEPSGAQVQEAEQGGGPGAQAAAYALLRDAERACGTSNPGAADRTYQHAIAAVTANPADFEAARQWLANLVAAADGVGIPACAGLALVDEASGQAIEQAQIHTGGS